MPHSVRDDPNSYPAIWRIAWPVMVNMGAHTLYSLVDLYWIGTLGTDAIAAVSLCGNILFSLFGLTIITQAGTLAMVSRRIGAQQLLGRDGAEGVATQALQLSLVLGALVAGIGMFAARPVLELFDASPATTEHGVDYLLPMLAGYLTIFPAMALGACFTAIGDTRTPMRIGIAANLLNAAIAPFFIFGWAGLPALGVGGAALAALLCQVLAFAAQLHLVRTRITLFPHPRFLRWYGTGAWGRLLAIGIPGGLGSLTRPFSTLFLMKLMAGFGPAGIAAFGIAVRSLMPTWLYYEGLATAVGTLTGHSLGRGDAPSVRRLVRRAVLLSCGLSLLIGLPYWFGAREVVGLFEKSNAEVLDYGALFVRLLVVANLSTAFGLVCSSVMNGAGSTRMPMVVAILSNWAIKLPLAYFLAVELGWGVPGVWWGMFVSILFESGANALGYRSGRWRHARV